MAPTRPSPSSASNTTRRAGAVHDRGDAAGAWLLAALGIVVVGALVLFYTRLM